MNFSVFDDRGPVIARGPDDKAIRAGKFILVGPFTAPVLVTYDAVHEGTGGYEGSTADSKVEFSTPATTKPLILWARSERGFHDYSHIASKDYDEKRRTVALPAFVEAMFRLEYTNHVADVTKAELYIKTKWA
jgi:hypothetical protein